MSVSLSTQLFLIDGTYILCLFYSQPLLLCFVFLSLWTLPLCCYSLQKMICVALSLSPSVCTILSYLFSHYNVACSFPSHCTIVILLSSYLLHLFVLLSLCHLYLCLWSISSFILSCFGHLHKRFI